MTSDRHEVLSDSNHSKQTETDSESRDNQSNVDTASPRQKNEQGNKTINHEQRPLFRGENLSVIIVNLTMKDLMNSAMFSNDTA